MLASEFKILDLSAVVWIFVVQVILSVKIQGLHFSYSQTLP